MNTSPESDTSGKGRTPYIYQRRVHFVETDMAGIVHFSVYFRYMEEAEHALWRDAGLSLMTNLAGYEFPRVRATFDYRRPLRFEDEFEVRLSIDEAASRTLRYRAEIVRGRDRVGTGSMTLACVRNAPGALTRATAFPDVIKQALGF